MNKSRARDHRSTWTLAHTPRQELPRAVSPELHTSSTASSLSSWPRQVVARSSRGPHGRLRKDRHSAATRSPTCSDARPSSRFQLLCPPSSSRAPSSVLPHRLEASPPAALGELPLH